MTKEIIPNENFRNVSILEVCAQHHKNGKQMECSPFSVFVCSTICNLYAIPK